MSPEGAHRDISLHDKIWSLSGLVVSKRLPAVAKRDDWAVLSELCVGVGYALIAAMSG
jgi:hypothetical protein